jgi:hypothetical protein
MAPWLIALLVSLIISAASYFLMRSQMPTKPKADEDLTDEIMFTAAKYGVPIPIVYGMARSGGQVIDLGDFTEVETEEGGKKGGITGYKYWIMSCVAITAGQTDELYWYEAGSSVNTPGWLAGSNDYQDFPVGDEDEPIERGRIYWGTFTQEPDPIIDDNMHTGLTPAYRCVTYAAFRFYLGQYVTTPPPTAFIIKRYPQPLSSIPSTIGLDANPTQIIYDLITNGNYGLRYPTNLINATSFTDCSSILVSEGLGASITFGSESGADLKSGLDSVLDWIDGALVDVNGQVELRLRRNYTDITSMLSITKNDIKKGSISIKRPGVYNTKNAINFTWKNRDRLMEDGNMCIDNQANIALTGTIRTIDYDFPIQTNKDTAMIVLSKLLRQASHPAAILEFELKNKTLINSLYVFDQFRLTYPKFDIENKIYRITKRGLTASHTCKIEALEDFTTPNVSFDRDDIPEGTQVESVFTPSTDPEWSSDFVTFNESSTRKVYASIRKSEPYALEGDVTYSPLYGIDVTASPTDFITSYANGVANTDRIKVNVLGLLHPSYPLLYDDTTLYLKPMIINPATLTFPLLTDTDYINGVYAFQIEDEIVYARYGEFQAMGDPDYPTLILYDLIRGCEYTERADHIGTPGVTRLQQDSVLEINPTYGPGSYVLTCVPLYAAQRTIVRDTANAVQITLNYQKL